MIFFIISVIVLFLIYFYPAKRVIVSFKRPFNTIAWVIVAVMFLMIPFHFLLNMRGASPLLSDLTGLLGFTSLGFMTLLFILIFLRDCVLITIRFFEKITQSSSPPNLERRKFLFTGSNLALTGITAAAATLGYTNSMGEPTLIKQVLTIPNLHPDLKGLSILQLSDIHVGPTIKKNFVQRVVTRCKDLNPDILVVTGDLADGKASLLQRDVEPLKMLHPRFGKYFVTGNHEYYSDLYGWLNLVQELGFDLLLNSHRTIRRGNGILTLAGVTDYHAGRIVPAHKTDPEKALQGCINDSTKILLAHQPKSVYKAAELGVDLQLSGHTHGGQYVPGNLFVKLDQPFVAGIYQYRATQLYVNRGTGYWGPPLRLGIASEITLFTLS